MDAFEKELRISFLQEVDQLLTDCEQYFLELEKKSNEKATIDKILRVAHNIKGSAYAVGFVDLANFTHELETFILRIKNDQLKVGLQTVSLLLACNDHLKKWVKNLFSDFNYQLNSKDLIDSMKSHAPGIAAYLNSIGPSEYEESAPQYLNQTIRVALPRLENLMKSIHELDALRIQLGQSKNEKISPEFKKTIDRVIAVSQEIHEGSTGLRMIPLKQTFQKIQRIVRDAAHELGKDIQLMTEGEDIEIDKIVLENLSDPLVHLIRNAVDHGIEMPDDRERAGKPRKGRIYVRAYQTAHKFIIQLRDDGRGLDPELLTKKAIEKGLLSASAQISDAEAQYLIFLPGFSTKSVATDLSGRGVGMDVVKNNIENRLKGRITLQSHTGMGTQINMLLPLSLEQDLDDEEVA